jgi:hypothetical protein
MNISLCEGCRALIDSIKQMRIFEAVAITHVAKKAP